MNPFDMLKNLQGLQERMASVQATIRTLKETGTAGGGMVKVEIDGTFAMTSVTIDESLMTAADREMVCDLIVAANRDAHGKIKLKIQKEMEAVSGGLPLPDMFGLNGMG